MWPKGRGEGEGVEAKFLNTQNICTLAEKWSGHNPTSPTARAAPGAYTPAIDITTSISCLAEHAFRAVYYYQGPWEDQLPKVCKAYNTSII